MSGLSTLFRFGQLPDEDRQAIFHFALLWSLFEAKALETRASAHSIVALVHKRSAQGQIDARVFEPSLRHFRNRYFSNGSFTSHFGGLNLRANDSPELVKQVLQGANNNPADVVAVLLIIIYRLRNNLFHGIKWADALRGQRSNFDFANAALMSAYEQLIPDGA